MDEIRKKIENDILNGQSSVSEWTIFRFRKRAISDSGNGQTSFQETNKLQIQKNTTQFLATVKHSEVLKTILKY